MASATARSRSIVSLNFFSFSAFSARSSFSLVGKSSENLTCDFFERDDEAVSGITTNGMVVDLIVSELGLEVDLEEWEMGSRVSYLR